MSLVDSHCHLDSSDFDADRAAVIDRARAAGVETLVNVSLDLTLAEQIPFVYAASGIHPHEAAKADEEMYQRVARSASHPKVVAVGEIGLDYHYDFAPRDVQQRVFIRQLEIAGEARRPIVIHTREAWADTVAILKANWKGGGIFHCFSEGPAEAEEALALGFHLSFSGILTFPKATAIHEAARRAPANRILVETDAPYLAPVPHRGRRNEPAFVVHTAHRLADLRGVSEDEIAASTTANWTRLLNLSPGLR